MVECPLCSAIWEELGGEPLLLHVEKSQMRWLGHLVRLPPGHLPCEHVSLVGGHGEDQGKLQETMSLAWNCLGIPPDQLDKVAGAREVKAALRFCFITVELKTVQKPNKYSK